MSLSMIHTGPFGVNTYIVPLCGPYVFVVDPAACALCGDETKISSCIAEHHYVPVAFVLTHGHFDHVSGLPFLKKCFPETPVFIHPSDSLFIGSGSVFAHEETLCRVGMEELLPAYENLPMADAYLSDGKTLLDLYVTAGRPFNDKMADGVNPGELEEALGEWKIIHTPGHTEGSCCLYSENNKMLFSGDTVFYRSWGRTDLPGGSETKIQRSLRTLYDMIPPDTLVYPGHDVVGFPISENCR